MVELRVPDINEEINVSNLFEYVELEREFKEEIKNPNSKVSGLLSELIALEISKYILFHTSGAPFDQWAADTIGSIHEQKRKELEEITGKEYVCHNNDW